MGNHASTATPRRSSPLRRFALLSAGLHLAILLLVLPALQSEPELQTQIVTEVELVDRQPEAPQPAASPRPSVEALAPQKDAPRARKRQRRAQQKSPPAQPAVPAPSETEQEVSPLLSMRAPEPSTSDDESAPPPTETERYTSFWSTDARPSPPPTSRQRLGSLEETRYADGGRVLRSTGGAPEAAAMGLLDLAAGRLGQRSGSQACNPYRDWRGGSDRELILMVDTSGSVVQNRRAPASLVCAAGAAIAALDRGIPVTVINFSSITQRYGPTRDLKVVYRALSTFQAEGTVLPSAGLLALGGGGPRDLVLISDTGIHNLKDVLPDYGKVLRQNPRNRALLYYLGGAAPEGLGPTEALKLIQRAGFLAEQVDQG